MGGYYIDYEDDEFTFEPFENLPTLKSIDEALTYLQKIVGIFEDKIDELIDFRIEYIVEHCEHDQGDTCALDGKPTNKEGYSCSDCAHTSNCWKITEEAENK